MSVIRWMTILTKLLEQQQFNVIEVFKHCDGRFGFLVSSLTSSNKMARQNFTTANG